MGNDRPMKPALDYDIFVPLLEASGACYAEAVTQSIKNEIADFFGGLRQNRSGGCPVLGNGVSFHKDLPFNLL